MVLDRPPADTVMEPSPPSLEAVNRPFQASRLAMAEEGQVVLAGSSLTLPEVKALDEGLRPRPPPRRPRAPRWTC